MDEKDQELLRLLSENARIPVTSLARALGLARSTVQARIERLEARGIIAGYALKLGDKARKERIRATVLVTIEPRAVPGVLARLNSLPEIESAHTASGRFDMILSLGSRSTAELDRALDEIAAIEGIRSSESLIHLSTRIDRGG